MTDGAQVLMRLTRDLQQANENERMTPETVSERNRIFHRAKQEATTLAAKEKAIKDNVRLTPHERESKLAALAQDVRSGMLEGLQKEKTAADEKGQRLNVTLSTVESPHDSPMLRQLRGMEIRGTIRSMSEGERMAAYLRAAEHNEIETLDAFLSSHEALIPAEVKSKGLAVRAQKTMPEIVELSQQQEFLTEHIDSLAAHVSNWATDLSS